MSLVPIPRLSLPPSKPTISVSQINPPTTSSSPVQRSPTHHSHLRHPRAQKPHQLISRSPKYNRQTVEPKTQSPSTQPSTHPSRPSQKYQPPIHTPKHESHHSTPTPILPPTPIPLLRLPIQPLPNAHCNLLPLSASRIHHDFQSI